MGSKGLGIAGAAAALGFAALGAGPAWAGHTPRSRTAAAPCAPSGTSLALTAEMHKFDKGCLAVTAGESFTIRFDNRDNDRHNVAILPSHESTEPMFAGDIIPGPEVTLYAVPSLKAGTYHFHCEVHPNLMNGTFVVAPVPADGQGGSTPPPMTKDARKPAAAPAPAPVKQAGSKAPAAKEGEAAAQAAPAPKPSPTPAPSRAAAAAGTDADASAAAPLARTGGPDRTLALLAGLALAAGGLAVVGGARARARA